MMTIERLPSGFYGVWNYSDTNEYAPYRADLIQWDGKRGTGGWEFNTHDSSTEYYIDADNTVYYKVFGGDTGIWCSGSRLRQHCHHLQQIKARR